MTKAITTAAQTAGCSNPAGSIFHLHNSQLVGSAPRTNTPELRSEDVSARHRWRKAPSMRRRPIFFGVHLLDNVEAGSRPCVWADTPRASRWTYSGASRIRHLTQAAPNLLFC